jgi:leucyl aminopeptidase
LSRSLLSSLTDRVTGAIPVHLVTKDSLPGWLETATPIDRGWVAANGFEAKQGARLLLPGGEGALSAVLYAFDPTGGPFAFSALALGLPAGTYRIETRLDRGMADDVAIGFALAHYRFDRYRKMERSKAQLVWPRAADRGAVTRRVEAQALVRDLINTPAEDMGPAELAEAARGIAKAGGAEFEVAVGDQLLKRNFPLVHAVGRASSRAPRLIDIAWGKHGPRVALVGKGVCFDSGGLDLKSAEGMKLMKKDMGGAAHVLALAQMVMAADLPLRLRVLVPAVDNLVSANAFKPMDIITSRKGLTVEIGNTDAEGRLILADALTLAGEWEASIIVDFATLTGAARVALGTEVPALFSNDDSLAERLLGASRKERDPLWRLPLWQNYNRLIDSPIADVNNSAEGGYGGSITAALFLERFVPKGLPWAHIDLMAWRGAAEPGRPAGGEAMGLAAAYATLAELAAEGGRKKGRKKN